MKTVKNTLWILFVAFGTMVASAQTAEEIIDNYFENTGGKEAWQNIEGMKMSGKAEFGPQSFDFTQTMMSDGKMLTEVSLQGQTFIPQAFDGKQMWGMNMQTMQPEAQDAETTENYKKNEAQEFPDPFLNYTENGYALELLGEEVIEGVNTYKIKLTKNKVSVDGVEEDNFTTYYFDAENFVPIISESTINSGPQKGTTVQTVYSDYQEAGDIFYPYTITMKFGGQVGQVIKIESIDVNPDVSEVNFSMPTKE